MKKFILSIVAFCACVFAGRADEGMWLLPLIEKMNGKAMKELGLKLTPKQIYDINNASLKDAIVQFGGGCTGEIISNEGLLVTNHHCGYGSIQKLSTPEHNYLEDGYWAMDRSKELPVKGLSVSFLQHMVDVTDILDKAYSEAFEVYKDSTDAKREEFALRMKSEKAKELVDSERKTNSNCKVSIQNFYNDNVYYLIVYKEYKDIRFVGAPPASVGKFGGETDNWMWPRHTGDFSMFRVYANKDNEPAEYSEDNKPFTPRRSLKISLKGVKDGDFTFIMGYPGRTQRFQTATQLHKMLDVNDIKIEARTLRQNVMRQFMEESPVIRLKYANKYASSANGWKKWQGQILAFEKLNIIGREEQKEADFLNWVNQKEDRVQKYGNALSLIDSATHKSLSAEKAYFLLSESVGRIEVIGMAIVFKKVFQDALMAGKDSVSAMNEAYKSLGREYEDYYEPLDREEAKALLKFYRERATVENYLFTDFENLNIDEYVDNLFDNSVFVSKEKLSEALNSDLDFITNDPSYVLYNSMSRVILNNYMRIIAQNDKLNRGSKAFGAGLMEWKKGQPSYPDANFTMRLTYGTVKPYSPKDGVIFNYYTTLKGVMEKEDPTKYEFRVPAKLKELYNLKDFGIYADKNGELPTCFLTNNDITGGNSGSPVLNAKGELVGLAFDGNWESMSSDVMFEPELQRCICVDIRYVLFMMEKFGGAKHLLEEINISK